MGNVVHLQCNRTRLLQRRGCREVDSSVQRTDGGCRHTQQHQQRKHNILNYVLPQSPQLFNHKTTKALSQLAAFRRLSQVVKQSMRLLSVWW